MTRISFDSLQAYSGEAKNWSSKNKRWKTGKANQERLETCRFIFSLNPPPPKLRLLATDTLATRRVGRSISDQSKFLKGHLLAVVGHLDPGAGRSPDRNDHLGSVSPLEGELPGGVFLAGLAKAAAVLQTKHLLHDRLKTKATT